MWITYRNHTLKFSDKTAIEQSEEMTNKHIKMAHHLVKVQFPVVGGLQSAKNWTTSTIQIIYCNKRTH